MSAPKLISPLLDNFVMGDPISEHNGVQCCPAINKETEEKYIVKIISVPASQVQLDALLLSGAYSDQDAALSYFKTVADDVVKEINTLNELADIEGFASVEAYQIVPMDDGCGYEIYILSLYRNTLRHHLRRNRMTHLAALNLGLDLCAALAVARRMGYIYVDLKPANIFLTNNQEFRIGDIGFIELASLPYASFPDRYRNSYTAPEIEDAYSSLNNTLDTYGVGMILYEIFNDGKLPSGDSDTLPAPSYADSEMAEIILKACASDPAERWQTPTDLGQALVSYMQKNGAHDVVIVPETNNDASDEIASDAEPVGRFEEQNADNVESVDEVIDDSASEPAEIVITEDAIFTEDSEGNLTLIDDDNDDTIEEDASDTVYDTVTDEVSEILEQADELLAHETPAPVVQPEPIDVQVPVVVLLDEEDISEDLESNTDEFPSDLPEEDISAIATDPSDEDNTSDDAELESEEEASDDSEDTYVPKKNRSWIAYLFLVIALCALILAGLWFYKNHYLQNIDDLILVPGENGSLVINIATKADQADLTVVCTDTYGIQRTSKVIGGSAVFTNLPPSTAFTINVNIAGFHKLTGKTTGAYVTRPSTEIKDITTITGAEDGSVIVQFTNNGADPKNWCITYYTVDATPSKVFFEGHFTTITGLTVGKEYTFEIAPDSDCDVTGNTTFKYTPSAVIKAENVTITGCSNKTLSVEWTARNDIQPESWEVQCYNNSGYRDKCTVTECSATFTIPDDTSEYTIEITAKNMSVGSIPITLPANSSTITGTAFDESVKGQLKVTWTAIGYVPADGWTLQYTIDGSVPKQISSIKENSVTLDPVIPGAKYAFVLSSGENTVVFDNEFEHTTRKAENFSGFTVDNTQMEFKMCLTPEDEEWYAEEPDWDYYLIEKLEYTTTFKIDDKASFHVHLGPEYETYDENHKSIEILYVIRDKNGVFIDVLTQTDKWVDMWWSNECGLDIPSLPQTPGEYTVTVYFNDAYAGKSDFTIKA